MFRDRRFIPFLAAAGLALSACSHAVDIIQEKLKPYMGQPVSALFGRLGYPTRQDQIAGRKVYIWATGGTTEGTSYSCTIRVFVDAQDIIVSQDESGSWHGCGGYVQALNR